MPQLSSSKYLVDAKGVKYTFAGFPEAKIYKESKKSDWEQHLLFGDYVVIEDTEIRDNRVRAKSRNKKGWINVSEIQPERILEVNFVDIGQGDGCHVVTPDDEHFIIDAGKSDNMNRYLTWRFNLYHKSEQINIKFDAVISHSDLDHYGGFKFVFQNKALKISDIYHNGIVERTGDKHLFGEVKEGYIVSLVTNTQEMKDLLNDPVKLNGAGSTYPETLSFALKNNPNVNFNMLSVDDHYISGFDQDKQLNNKEFSIRVLGPIPEMVDGKKALKTIKNSGKDKNGHSVILKLVYGHLRLLLGGDLNEEFGKTLFDYYTEKGQIADLVMDVSKACHHGSNHFDYNFLNSLNSAATVISSGDDEPYAHPRPETLGAIGKTGYGMRPLIFSTELARSNKEITRKNLEILEILRAEIAGFKSEITKLKSGTDAKKDAKIADFEKKITKNEMEINSFLTRYGMINLRSDGEKMIIAQKYERDAPTGKWDIHELLYDKNTGRFELQ